MCVHDQTNASTLAASLLCPTPLEPKTLQLGQESAISVSRGVQMCVFLSVLGPRGAEAKANSHSAWQSGGGRRGMLVSISHCSQLNYSVFQCSGRLQTNVISAAPEDQLIRSNSQPSQRERQRSTRGRKGRLDAFGGLCLGSLIEGNGQMA